MPKYIREKKKPVTPPPPDAGCIEISLPLLHPSAKHFPLWQLTVKRVSGIISFSWFNSCNMTVEHTFKKKLPWWNKWKGGGAGMRLKSTLGIFPTENKSSKTKKGQSF